MASAEVNNSIYDSYGDRWYTAYDDPIAILRAANRAKLPWILNRLPESACILDVGCGAGFLSNALAERGYSVTGLDLSAESLEVAKRWDKTKKVNYIAGDAYALPFPAETFSVVTVMDFLEHVEDPRRVILECRRVLKPGGKIFFSTLNRNFVSWIIGIKFLEWFVKNTPKHMHLHRLFLKPQEVGAHCIAAGLEKQEFTGLRPILSSVPISSIISGVVPESLEFGLTPSTKLMYLGVATSGKDSRHA